MPLEINDFAADIRAMADIIFALLELLVEGSCILDGLAGTGRSVLSLGGWKSNLFGEFLLGIMVWSLFGVLFVALFAALV
jgi:hypothetical protein